MNRRWRNLLPRRGQFFLVPKPQIGPGEALPTPAFSEQSGSRPRWLPSRRGRITSVTPQAAVAPSLIPGFIDQSGSRPRFGAYQRRGRFFAPIPRPVLAIDASTPDRFTGVTDASGVFTTGAFNTPANCLILVTVGLSSPISTVATVTPSNNGAAATWTPVGESHGHPGLAGAYYTYLTAARSGLTATLTSNVGANRYIAVKIYNITGAFPTAPIGGRVVSSASGSPVTTTGFSVTTANGLGFVVDLDDTDAGPASSTDTNFDAFENVLDVSGGSGYKNLGAVGSTAQFNVTGGSTAAWNYLTFEIRATATDAPPALLTRRSRYTVLPARRGSYQPTLAPTLAGQSCPLAPATNLAPSTSLYPCGGPPPVPSITAPRRYPGLPFRRGQLRPLVPPPIVAAPPPARAPGFIDPAGPRPRWTPTSRRGVFQPTPGALPAPVSWLLRRLGWRPRWAPLPRRGLFFPPPTTGPVVATVFTVRRVRRLGASPRRGSFFRVPQPQIGPGEALPAPALNRTPVRRGFIARRGQFFTLSLGAPFVAPSVIRRAGYRPKWAPAIRRGTFLLVPPPQVGPGEGTLAPSVQRHWQRFGFVARRGAFFAAPAPALGYAPVVPVVVKPARRYLGLLARRGVALRVLPSLGYAPVVPARIVSRRQGLSVRRGSFQAIPPVAPVAFSLVSPARRSPAHMARRGVVRPRPWFEPPGPAPLTPSVIRQAGFRPRWFPLPRRGQFSSALLVGLAPPPVVAVPAVLTHRRVGFGAIRRGAFGPVVLVVTPPAGQQTRSRVRLVSPRRGSFQALSLPALGYSPVVPAIIKPVRHYAGLPVRRGFALRVLPSLGYGPLVPARVIPARRYSGISARRGAFQALTQALSPAPQSLRRPRAVGVAVRRGTFQALPLATAAPVGQQARARVRLATTRRGNFQTLPAPSLGYGPLVAARTAPARRLLGLPVRHGVVRPRPWFAPPGPQALVPPFIHHSGSRPKWGPLPRRGQFSSALLVGLAPPPPPPPPPPPVGNVARNPRRIALVRRGQFFVTPQAAPAISAVFVRRVRAAVSIRRGTFLAVVPTPRITPWVPAPIQARRAAAASVHRGTFQPTPAAAPIVLRPSARTRIALWVRRGQFQTVPAATQVVPPRIPRPTTPRIATVRRGHISTPLSAPAAPPRWYRCTRPAPGTRRGQFNSPPWTKPAGPGPLCPSILRATRRYPGLPFRRGRFIQGVVPPQVVFPEPVAGSGKTTPLAVATTGTTAALAVATSSTTTPAAVAAVASTGTITLAPGQALSPSTGLAPSSYPTPAATGGTTTPTAVATPHQ